MYIHLCLLFSLLVSSQVVFPSYFDLSKDPDAIVISHASLVPKNVFKGFMYNRLFPSSDITSPICTLTQPFISKVTANLLQF